MKKYFTWIAAIISALLLGALYTNWLVSRNSISTHGLIASLAASVLFYICLQFVLSKLYDFWTEPKCQPPLLSVAQKVRQKAWLQILIFMVVSRLAIYIYALALAYFSGRWSNNLLETMHFLWVRSDANSYLGLAQNWYVTEGDPRFHIVFFPFYPIVIKLFQLILQDYLVSALVVSNLCAFGAAILTYELAALDMPSEKALRAVKYLFLLPAAVFFAAPMTESLFLLLSVGCVYLVRKRHYLPACILGALASFTRSPGVILLVLIFIEYVRDLIDQYRTHKPNLRPFWKQFWGRGCCMLLVPLGLLGYILINYLVTGNPFQFAIYQREHWSQSFGYFFNTASVHIDNMANSISEGNLFRVFGLWLTNLVAMFGSLILMIVAARKVRASYSAYYLVYFVITLGVTWLLSGPRYLTVVFPLAFALAALIRRKISDWIATAILFGMHACYLYMFLVGSFQIY